MFELYRRRVSSNGSVASIGQALKLQSDMIMNETFLNDINTKKVLIKKDGVWKEEYAKYQVHTTPSILKDNVDYYLQFRPGVHYDIGTYVIVPDDTCFDVKETDFKSKYCWLIVGRDNSNQFVRYNILQCNWDFKWVYENKIYSCWAVLRSANSYSSGIGIDDMTVSLENQLAAWIPDNDETRTITYDVRFMIGLNSKYPKVYKTTKILDAVNQGTIKLTFKQDEYNPNTDNVELGICDYYKSSITPTDYEPEATIVGTSVISLAKGVYSVIKVGGDYKYLKYTVYDASGNEIIISPVDMRWNISCSNPNIVCEDSFEYGYDYELNLFKIKAKVRDSALIGSVVTISLADYLGNYASTYKMEVTSL